MKIHRLIAILLILDSVKKIKAGELAERLEVSRRTIYRDIETLSEIGIPIATTTGPDGGVHMMDGYSVRMNELLGDEVMDLYLSSMGIHPTKDSDFGLRINKALLKLEKNLSAGFKNELVRVKEKFYFDRDPWWGEPPNIPCIDDLVTATWQGRKLKIKYEKNNGEVSSRTIRPYGIVVKRMAWYLVCFCELSSALRTFKCERILAADITDEKFTIPDDFSLTEYWEKSSERFRKGCRDEEHYPVVLKINRTERSIMERFDVYSYEEKCNSIYVEANLHKYEFACTEVQEIIGRVEVISPPELREFTRSELSSLLDKYNENQPIE